MKQRNRTLALLTASILTLSLASPALAASYTVAPGDTLGDIGARYGVKWEEIARQNGITDPTKLMGGTVLQIGGLSADGTTYSVAYGDTLAGIAKELGTTVEALAQRNGIQNPNRLKAGTLLKVTQETPAPAEVLPTPVPTQAPAPVPSVLPELPEPSVLPELPEPEPSVRPDVAALTLDQYLAQTEEQWFATGKRSYVIQGKMVSADEHFRNELEGTDYTAKPNGEDVVLKGTSGEQWIAKLSKVITTYTKTDGTELTAADFKADTFIDLQTKASTGNFAMFIPAGTKVDVNTAWGDLLHANRDGVPHGAGDYLVCRAGTDGKPDLADVWVVNGETFPDTYDRSAVTGYTETDVTVMNGNRAVPATIVSPTGEGPFPAVVINHGHGGSRDENGGLNGIAAALAKAGILTIRMDFPGCGDSKEPFTENNLTNMVSDSNACLDYMLKNCPVDKDSLGILGYSMGGRVALTIAEGKDSPYQAVGLLAPAAIDAKAMAGSLFGDLENYNKLAAEARGTKGYANFTTQFGQEQQLSKAWFDDMGASLPLSAENAKQYTGPMLVVHGDKDVVVTGDMNKAVTAAFPQAQEVIIPDADHGYGFFSDQPDVTAKVQNNLASFFAAHLDTGKTVLYGTVTEVEKYGHTVLSIPIQTALDKGLTLGDALTVTYDNGFTAEHIPFLSGYDVDKGAYMVRAYPGHENIAVCINYGKINEVAGVGVGSTAAVTLAEPKAFLAEYEMSQLTRTNERADYASDAVFANFRGIQMGNIAEGVLYRASNPVNNELGRASAVDALVEAAGIQVGIDLADSKEDMEKHFAAEDFRSPYYKGLYEADKVITLAMSVDYSSQEFGDKLAQGLIFMSENKGPYLVHCNEGKDRAGFTSALLEALMGAKLEEIVADYMVSYENYYHLDKTKDADQYQLIVDRNIMDMLRSIAGLEKGADLSKTDLAKAAEGYLTAHGMTPEQITALKTNLSTPVSGSKAA